MARPSGRPPFRLSENEAAPQQVHRAEQIRQRFGFATEEAFLLQDAPAGHGFALLGKLIEYDVTDVIFKTPARKETEDYITGRFG